MRRVRIAVRGRVQGVGFRATTLKRARELGVAGWVRNRGDGSVEILAEGAADSVQALADWCHHGPRAAAVSNVDIAEEPPGADLVGFEMRF